MATFRIQFLPDGRETTIDAGKTLLEAAREANVYVGAVCGGEGTCGKCRLVVREGEVEANAVMQTLRKNDFNRTATAKALGISRRALIYKLQRLRELGHIVDGPSKTDQS